MATTALIPRQRRTPTLELLRARHAREWEILRTTEAWYAVRRDTRPVPPLLIAHTARSLLRDLERVEEATR